jgi:hypothetical protein
MAAQPHVTDPTDPAWWDSPAKDIAIAAHDADFAAGATLDQLLRAWPVDIDSVPMPGFDAIYREHERRTREHTE